LQKKTRNHLALIIYEWLFLARMIMSGLIASGSPCLHIFFFCSEGFLVKRNPKVLAAIQILLSPTVLFCQQTDHSTPADPQTIRLLLERICQLEASQK